MKLLLLLIPLLLFSSCGTFDRQKRYNPNLSKKACIYDFYTVGMSVESAIEACEFVLKRGERK